MLKKLIILTLILLSLSFANLKFWNGDNVESLGLNGEHDSLGYRVAEIETHFHSPEYWFGSTAGSIPASQNSLTAFTLTTGGVNTYGNFLQIANGSELIVQQPTCKYVDIHRVLITGINQADSTYMI